jgi:hypothetical protein
MALTEAPLVIDGAKEAGARGNSGRGLTVGPRMPVGRARAVEKGVGPHSSIGFVGRIFISYFISFLF